MPYFQTNPCGFLMMPLHGAMSRAARLGSCSWMTAGSRDFSIPSTSCAAFPADTSQRMACVYPTAGIMAGRAIHVSCVAAMIDSKGWRKRRQLWQRMIHLRAPMRRSRSSTTFRTRQKGYFISGNPLETKWSSSDS